MSRSADFSSVQNALTSLTCYKDDNVIVVNDDSVNAIISWMELFSIEWRRIIKPNGSIFMFCSSAMESQLHMMLAKRFNIFTSLNSGIIGRQIQLQHKKRNIFHSVKKNSYLCQRFIVTK